MLAGLGFEFMSRKEPEKLHEDCVMMSHGLDLPGAYSRPFTLYETHRYLHNTELMEYICNENNQDVEHIVGKDPRNIYSEAR